MRARIILCASLVAAAFGCNAIAGINEPIDGVPSGTGVDAGGAPVEDGGGPPPNPLDRFVGTWRTPNGAAALSQCELAQTFTGPAEERVALGSTSDLELTPADAPFCRLRCNVSGDTATVLPGETCAVSSAESTATYAYDQLTFTLSPDGTQGELEILATVDYDPQGVTCVFEERSTYFKQ